MADSKGTLKTLNNLIKTCRNGQTGYLHAAAKTKDAQLKVFFDEQSRERGRFAVELTEQAKKLGEVASRKAGTVTGVLHRAWFELKADVGGGDIGIVHAVKMGESRAQNAYKKAVSSSLPADVKTVIARQYESVKAAHDRVSNYKGKPIARSA